MYCNTVTYGYFLDLVQGKKIPQILHTILHSVYTFWHKEMSACSVTTATELTFPSVTAGPVGQ